jgi:dTDP-4-amino-4,6-dideoxygalactose transaminase
MIKLFDPPKEEAYLRSIARVFQSGMWATGAGGPLVRRFEDEFNKYIGSLHTVAVNSGSSALHLALGSIPCRGRKVLVPSLGFVSSAHAIREAGAEPVFIDIDEYSLNVSTRDLFNKLTADTAAILVVHFAGRPCDMNAVNSISKEGDVFVIEDCAHACGAALEGKKTGALSHLGCFSFHPVKNLATFGGGAITINDSRIERKSLDNARWFGIDVRNRLGPKYDVTEMGWNYYMCEASAALALAQLPSLDKANAKRREIANFYDEEFSGLDWLVTPPYSDECVYHIYPARVTRGRDKFIRYMAEKGIECGIHYARGIHQFSYYAGYKVDLPVTERIVDQLVSIPIYPSLSSRQLDTIVTAARKFK